MAINIPELLRDNDAVLDGHFVATSGKHLQQYFDVRRVSHMVAEMDQIGVLLATALRWESPDIIIGPETLGRTLATYAGIHMGRGTHAIWCDVLVRENGVKYASFSEKMSFGRLIEGRRVAVVDDMVTTGLSIKMTSDLVAEFGGEVVAAAAVVRRNPNITAEDCGAPVLHVLAEMPANVPALSPEECAANGPCSRQVPMTPRPGHGYKFLADNPAYPASRAV